MYKLSIFNLTKKTNRAIMTIDLESTPDEVENFYSLVELMKNRPEAYTFKVEAETVATKKLLSVPGLIQQMTDALPDEVIDNMEEHDLREKIERGQFISKFSALMSSVVLYAGSENLRKIEGC